MRRQGDSNPHRPGWPDSEPGLLRVASFKRHARVRTQLDKMSGPEARFFQVN